MITCRPQTCREQTPLCERMSSRALVVLHSVGNKDVRFGQLVGRTEFIIVSKLQCNDCRVMSMLACVRSMLQAQAT